MVLSGSKTQGLATLNELIGEFGPILKKVSSHHLKHYSGGLGPNPPLAFVCFVSLKLPCLVSNVMKPFALDLSH